jgi:hypothetical protein
MRTSGELEWGGRVLGLEGRTTRLYRGLAGRAARGLRGPTDRAGYEPRVEAAAHVARKVRTGPA